MFGKHQQHDNGFKDPAGASCTRGKVMTNLFARCLYSVSGFISFGFMNNCASPCKLAL
jgi:hypothetical protein